MSDLRKIFYLVNDGDTLAAYKDGADLPWFVLERAHCSGRTPEQQAESFNEAVKFMKHSFGPLADYRQLREPNLPGIPR